MFGAKKVYSYIRYPLSRGGKYSLVLSLISFALTQYVVFAAISAPDEVNLFDAAVGLSAILWAALGVIFAAAGLREQEKNYRMAIVGAALSVFVLVEWVVVLTG